MSEPVYAGLSRVHLDIEAFDFGHGVRIRQIYAHLFASPLIAFQRAQPGSAHPAPWIAADGGGYSHDIEVELSIDGTSKLPGELSAVRTIALITSLLRLANLTLTVPILSDTRIDLQSATNRNARLQPFETGKRVISGKRKGELLSIENLQWARDRWPVAAELVRSNSDFENGLSACDNCVFDGRSSASLMLAWGALEGLFAKGSRSETTHRVAAYIAAFIRPPGPERLALFKRAKQLYGARSKVAHSAADGDLGELLETFMILREAIIRILNRGLAPTPDLLEQLLFDPPNLADRRG